MQSMIEQFRDFAASKPGDEEYYYVDNRRCAVMQFSDEIGLGLVSLTSNKARYSDGRTERPSDGLRRMLEIANGPEWVDTFGALTERLDAALAERTAEIADFRADCARDDQMLRQWEDRS